MSGSVSGSRPPHSPVVRRRRPGGGWGRARVPRLPGLAGVRLLVVDGDAAEPLGEDLREAGVLVTRTPRACDALVLFGTLDPHVVLVRPCPPDLSAGDLVRTLRRFGSQPVLVGVGPQEADAAGPAFVAGASSAVSLPYDAREVVGRIAAELPGLGVQAPLTFGPLRLDPLAHTVHAGGAEVAGLPRKEFELLRLLLTHADQVVAQAQVKATLWAEAVAAPSDNAVAVHVTRLRARLPAGVELRTVRGLGYRLALTGT